MSILAWQRRWRHSHCERSYLVREKILLVEAHIDSTVVQYEDERWIRWPPTSTPSAGSCLNSPYLQTTQSLHHTHYHVYFGKILAPFIQDWWFQDSKSFVKIARIDESIPFLTWFSQTFIIVTIGINCLCNLWDSPRHCHLLLKQLKNLLHLITRIKWTRFAHHILQEEIQLLLIL